MVVYITAGLLTTVIGVLSPYIIGNFLDTLILGADVNAIFRFCFIFGGLSLVRVIKSYASSSIYVRLHSSMSNELNMDAIKHVQNLSLSYASQHDSAYLCSRINADANEIVKFSLAVMQSVIANSVMIAVPFVIMLGMHAPIALALLIFLAVYATIFVAFKKPLYNTNRVYMESYNKYYSSLFEQLKHIMFIRANSVQPEFNKRVDEKFWPLRADSIRRQMINYFYSSLDNIVSTAAQITLFVVGGIQVLAGNFTIGMFTIFSSYFIMMISSAKSLFNLGASYQNVKAAYDRTEEILMVKKGGGGGIEIDGIKEVSVRDVSFCHGKYEAKLSSLVETAETVRLMSNKEQSNEKRKPVMDRQNAEFKKGHIYALVGVNGSGKSTFISLILGLYDDEHDGCISYNGIDIRNIDMVSARKRHIALAEQEPQLVNDTVVYNILTVLGNPSAASIEPSNRLVKLLGMEELIEKGISGYKINDKNTNISGGEKQKIAILRTLLKDSSFMIFDEPTSALDAKTASNFMEYLKSIKNGKIIIIVSHERDVIEACDAVVELI